MPRTKKLKPAVRIDGGKRIDLKAHRERRGIVVRSPDRQPRNPQVEKKERARQARNTEKLIRSDGGKDGAQITTVKIRISGDRSEKQIVRCRPGTFEWRYGRKKQDALFHAGSHFAQLWERAGIAVSSSADFLRGTMSGYSTGVPDGRVIATRKVSDAVKEIGRFSASRLLDYCVLGLTASEIARKHGQVDRDMAAVLHQDLRACAMHFRFL